MPMRLLLLVLLFVALPSQAATGTVETRVLDSQVLAENRVGLNTRRPIKVYLPPGYAASRARYPVIYMLHGLNWNNERMFDAASRTQATFDKAITDGVIKPFIAVAPDYTTQGPGTFFVNSTTAGRFEDFTVNEVVPSSGTRNRSAVVGPCSSSRSRQWPSYPGGPPRSFARAWISSGVQSHQYARPPANSSSSRSRSSSCSARSPVRACTITMGRRNRTSSRR